MILDMVRYQVLIVRFEIKFLREFLNIKLINGVIGLVVNAGQRKILKPLEEY